TANKFFFLAGAAFEAAHQMLDAFLTGGNHFVDANLVRNVADNRNSDLVRLGGGGQIGIVGNHRLHLDEVDSLRLQRVDRGCGAGGGGDGNRTRETQLAVLERSVEHRAGDHHARANDVSSGNLFAPSEQHRHVAAHVAHTSDAVGDEQRQDDVAPARKPVAEGGVHVHVPEAR